MCHRLGLLPVYANARDFDFPDNPVTETNAGNDKIETEPEGDPGQNLIFEVNVCVSRILHYSIQNFVDEMQKEEGPTYGHHR